MQRALLIGLVVAPPGARAAGAKKKAEVQAEIAKIDEACRGGESDKARTLMLDAAKKNETFKRAFEAATSGVPDKNRINACGLVLTEIKTRLKNS
jgi:hypothetical protein